MISSSHTNIVVLALYQFAHLENTDELRNTLLAHCQQCELLGTLLLASEGINGTVAGRREGIDSLLELLAEDGRFSALEYKESFTETAPFHRMKVKLKQEIVSFGVAGIDPSELTGKRVAAKDWNALISDPEVLLIDTRNQFETEIGSFKNSISPHTASFREFPEFVDHHLDADKHKKVAMFCTGGIRCEKASAYLVKHGFENVYQLDGGILRYLEEIRAEESLWQGECFVFDSRVAVNEHLEQGVHQLCYACRRPLSPADRTSELYEEGVSCPHCHAHLSDQKRQGLRERQRQVMLAEQRQQQHIGAPQPASPKKCTSPAT